MSSLAPRMAPTVISANLGIPFLLLLLLLCTLQ